MNRTKTGFENLVVYQLAVELSDIAWDLVKRWPRFERQTMGRQLVRSVDSIGANLAEGAGRGSEADNRRFIYIARGSLYETKYWIHRCHHRGLLRSEDVDALKPLMEKLPPMLNAYLRSVG
ncbi:four helix bundle protein [Longibacter sp.]|jgi:four helix bundle protein|uniref:four helix bundle protein n=1 Tax=Longibacter sp. TaxID=2045415 RepID=UPI003EB8824A